MIFYIVGNTNIINKPKSFWIKIKRSVEIKVENKLNNKLTKKGNNLLSWLINYFIMITIFILPLLFIVLNIISLSLGYPEDVFSVFSFLSIYFYLLPGIIFMLFPLLVYFSLSRIIFMFSDILFGLERSSLVDLYPIGIRRMIIFEDLINYFSILILFAICLRYLIPLIKEDFIK